MELSREQQIAFDKYVKGENLFITGPGGSGKSELIRRIYHHAYHNYREIYVTATTGCASVLLNCKAKTLHSWAGIGLGKGTTMFHIEKIKRNHFAKKMWKSVDVLIVDEVSMLSMKLFNMLNDIGKAVRKNYRPFGGIQVIFSGDFFQLPPVGDRDEPDTMRFCFESDEWNAVFPRDNQIELQKIFRQTDELYASILNQIREGRIKRKANDFLTGFVGRQKDPSLIAEPTKLFPTKNKVEQINISKMAELTSPVVTFHLKQRRDLEMTASERETRLHYSDQEIQIELDFLSGNLMCDKELNLKQGAQVMSVVNLKSESGDVLICNGSQGVVLGYCPLTGSPRVRFNNGIEMVMTPFVWASDRIPGVGVTQVPLILSWALTIHKSQGATLDAAEIDVGSGIFECGQTYVALSRVKNLSGLYLTSFDASRIRIHAKVKEFYESLRLYHAAKETNEEVYVPLVIAEEVQEAIPLPEGAVQAIEMDDDLVDSSSIKVVRLG